MKRLLSLSLTLALIGTLSAAPTADQKKTKAALRELQDYIGGWKGDGQTKASPGPRDPSWSETVNWSWRFKGDDAWLTIDFKGGKFLKSAEVRYAPKTKTYQLSGTPVEGKDKLVFEGKLEDDKLVFERKDPATKDVQRIRMNIAGEGIRFIYQVDQRTETGTIWKFQYKVATTKVGESLAKKKKGPECVVSGGLGTIQVSYNGTTYYVCCSGCADAFKESPKKYVDEFEKSKKK
jgi:YHS domain